MPEFKTSEDLKEFILNNRIETDDEPKGTSGPCYSISFKKDKWIIRLNNKKILEFNKEELPHQYLKAGNTFVFDALAILRKEGLDGLKDLLNKAV